MADRIADNPDLLVDEMKRKARRRLVGAIVLALAAAVILPLLLEKEPRPLGDDVSVQIPPVDEGKFVNRLTGKSGDAEGAAEGRRQVGAQDGRKARSQGRRRDPSPSPMPSSPRRRPARRAFRRRPPGAAARPTKSTAPKKPVADVEPRAQAAAAKAEAKSVAGSKAETKAGAGAQQGRDEARAGAEGREPQPEAARRRQIEPAPLPRIRRRGDRCRASAARPTSDAPAGTPPAVPAKADGFVVQLAAFADDKGANALANKLKKVGYAAYVEPVQTSRGTLWRVRVGGYASRSGGGRRAREAQGRRPQRNCRAVVIGTAALPRRERRRGPQVRQE